MSYTVSQGSESNLESAITEYSLSAGGPGSGRHPGFAHSVRYSERSKDHDSAAKYHESRIKEIERAKGSLSKESQTHAKAHRDAAYAHHYASDAIKGWEKLTSKKNFDPEEEDNHAQAMHDAINNSVIRSTEANKMDLGGHIQAQEAEACSLKGCTVKSNWQAFKKDPTYDNYMRAHRIKGGKIEAKSPPGFGGTVEHMKEHKEITNAPALAWYMYEKGDKSHKAAPKGTGAKHVSKEVAKKRSKAFHADKKVGDIYAPIKSAIDAPSDLAKSKGTTPKKGGEVIKVKKTKKAIPDHNKKFQANIPTTKTKLPNSMLEPSR